MARKKAVVKRKTKEKVKVKIVYRNDPEVIRILDYYKNKSNYKPDSSGIIQILMDNGDMARNYTNPIEDDDWDYEDEDENQKVAVKQTKSKTPKRKTVTKNDTNFIVIDASKEDKKKEKLPPKNWERSRREGESDDRFEIVQAECSVCKKMRNFRKFETERTLDGEFKMDLRCSKCCGGGN